MEDYNDPCRAAQLANKVDFLLLRVAKFKAAIAKHKRDCYHTHGYDMELWCVLKKRGDGL